MFNGRRTRETLYRKEGNQSFTILGHANLVVFNAQIYTPEGRLQFTMFVFFTVKNYIFGFVCLQKYIGSYKIIQIQIHNFERYCLICTESKILYDTDIHSLLLL